MYLVMPVGKAEYDQRHNWLANRSNVKIFHDTNDRPFRAVEFEALTDRIFDPRLFERRFIENNRGRVRPGAAEIPACGQFQFKIGNKILIDI